VPNIIGTILFLQLGYGLRGLIVNEAVTFGLTTILVLVYSFRLLPELEIRLTLCQGTSLRQLLTYGMKVQVSQLAYLASSQMDKLLLGFFLGPSLVTFYELGSKVVLAGKRLSLVMLSAILPAASEIEARQDRRSLDQLYIRGSKYLVLAAFPAMFFLIVSAPLVMDAWMGTGYELSVLAIQTLGLGHLVHLLAGVGTTIVKGIGKPEYETQYTLLLLVLETVLGIALVMKIGFLGVLIATPVSLIVSSLYFMIIFHRFLKMSLIQLAHDVHLKPVGACLLAGTCFYFFNHVLARFFLLQGRLANIGILGLGGLVFIVVYLGLLLHSNYLDEYDKKLMTVLSLIREPVARPGR
jgi:O-antigen/teichoic acid export membrane protein